MAEAKAISESVTRPNMRFVPTKTPEQQSGQVTPSHAPSVHSPADLCNQCDPRSPAEFGGIAPGGRSGIEELLGSQFLSLKGRF